MRTDLPPASNVPKPPTGTKPKTRGKGWRSAGFVDEPRTRSVNLSKAAREKLLQQPLKHTCCPVITESATGLFWRNMHASQRKGTANPESKRTDADELYRVYVTACSDHEADDYTDMKLEVYWDWLESLGFARCERTVRDILLARVAQVHPPKDAGMPFEAFAAAVFNSAALTLDPCRKARGAAADPAPEEAYAAFSVFLHGVLVPYAGRTTRGRVHRDMRWNRAVSDLSVVYRAPLKAVFVQFARRPDQLGQCSKRFSDRLSRLLTLDDWLALAAHVRLAAPRHMLVRVAKAAQVSDKETLLDFTVPADRDFHGSVCLNFNEFLTALTRSALAAEKPSPPDKDAAVPRPTAKPQAPGKRGVHAVGFAPPPDKPKVYPVRAPPPRGGLPRRQPRLERSHNMYRLVSDDALLRSDRSSSASSSDGVRQASTADSLLAVLRVVCACTPEAELCFDVPGVPLITNVAPATVDLADFARGPVTVTVKAFPLCRKRGVFAQVGGRDVPENHCVAVSADEVSIRIPEFPEAERFDGRAAAVQHRMEDLLAWMRTVNVARRMHASTPPPKEPEPDAEKRHEVTLHTAATLLPHGRIQVTPVFRHTVDVSLSNNCIDFSPHYGAPSSIVYEQHMPPCVLDAALVGGLRACFMAYAVCDGGYGEVLTLPRWRQFISDHSIAEPFHPVYAHRVAARATAAHRRVVVPRAELRLPAPELKAYCLDRTAAEGGHHGHQRNQDLLCSSASYVRRGGFAFTFAPKPPSSASLSSDSLSAVEYQRFEPFDASGDTPLSGSRRTSMASEEADSLDLGVSTSHGDSACEPWWGFAGLRVHRLVPRTDVVEMSHGRVRVEVVAAENAAPADQRQCTSCPIFHACAQTQHLPGGAKGAGVTFSGFVELLARVAADLTGNLHCAEFLQTCAAPPQGHPHRGLRQHGSAGGGGAVVSLDGSTERVWKRYAVFNGPIPLGFLLQTAGRDRSLDAPGVWPAWVPSLQSHDVTSLAALDVILRHPEAVSFKDVLLRILAAGFLLAPAGNPAVRLSPVGRCYAVEVGEAPAHFTHRLPPRLLNAAGRQLPSLVAHCWEHAGTFATLWWQAANADLHHPEATVVVYVDDASAQFQDLLSAFTSTASLMSFRDRLQGIGYRFSLVPYE
ncbi:hypothetical protein DIPPA_11166 [Diplonema papillatum]|nr:hypothetical protein DIPPA_11166 [Diplonema papillatum]